LLYLVCSVRYVTLTLTDQAAGARQGVVVGQLCLGPAKAVAVAFVTIPYFP
jgi:hypothetical protein